MAFGPEFCEADLSCDLFAGHAVDESEDVACAVMGLRSEIFREADRRSSGFLPWLLWLRERAQCSSKISPAQ